MKSIHNRPMGVGGRRARLALAAILATTALVASAHPATARDHETAAASEVERAVAVVAPPAHVLGGHRSDLGSVTAEGARAATVAPRDGAGQVVVTGSPGLAIGIGLPKEAHDASAVVADGGSVVYLDPEGLADVVVQPLDSGARIATVIHGVNSPTRFSFDFADEVVLRRQGDGSVDLVIDAGGAFLPVGHIDAPWATDALGSPVPTEYVVDGSTLTQVVHHVGSGVAYPVVADPRYSPGILSSTWYFNRAETKSISQQSDAAVIATCVVAGAAGGPVVAAVMGVKCASIVIPLKYNATLAVNSGKCVYIRLYTATTWVTSGTYTGYSTGCR